MKKKTKKVMASVKKVKMPGPKPTKAQLKQASKRMHKFMHGVHKKTKKIVKHGIKKLKVKMSKKKGLKKKKAKKAKAALKKKVQAAKKTKKAIGKDKDNKKKAAQAAK